jgi:hypothetical protein
MLTYKKQNVVITSLCTIYGAFTLDVKSVLNEILDGILHGMQCLIGDSLMLSE